MARSVTKTIPAYFDLEVSLLDIEPRIWRRFLIHSEATFLNLHHAIQQSFGWQDCHLYEFLDGKGNMNDTGPLYALKLPRIARSEHADPLDDEPDAPEAGEIELGQYFSAKDERCFYVYDFGDNWQHVVELKSILKLPETFTRRLLDGARACPPEDCGGTMGSDCVEGVAMSITPEIQAVLRAKEGCQNCYLESECVLDQETARDNLPALTYVVHPTRRLDVDLPVTAEYRQLILDGAKQFNFTEWYQEVLRRTLRVMPTLKFSQVANCGS